ncbi:MAG: RNA polymerase subunit sigma-24 [Verrucomicrobiaceae bacterium]|nr:RNA polymerase subunit sigma-24 [Verrucomicrobiaceae bacterium]
MSPTLPSPSFQATRWSLVRAAASHGDSSGASQALAEICEVCWYPVYAYIRRAGNSEHDAQDLTQGFFTKLIEKDILAAADPSRGKLRSFLLTCVGNFLHHEHARSIAAKRDVRRLTSFDAQSAEERYRHEPVDRLTPDRLYQRRWALTLLESTLELLKKEYDSTGKGTLFHELRPFLGFGSAATRSYEEIATQLSMPLGTLKNHIFRMRQRWRDLLFERVAATLEDPTSDNVKAELAELMECL